jgi:hypothetical protein
MVCYTWFDLVDIRITEPIRGLIGCIFACVQLGDSQSMKNCLTSIDASVARASEFINTISLAQSSLSLFAAFRVEKGIDTTIATGIKNQRKVLLILDLYIALLGVSFRMRDDGCHDVIAKLLDHLWALEKHVTEKDKKAAHFDAFLDFESCYQYVDRVFGEEKDEALGYEDLSRYVSHSLMDRLLKVYFSSHVYVQLDDKPALEEKLIKLGNSLFLSSLEPGRTDNTVTLAIVASSGKTKKLRTSWSFFVECFTQITGIIPEDKIHDLFVGGDVASNCQEDERNLEVFHILQQLVEKFCHDETVKECGLLIEAVQGVVEKCAPDLPDSLYVWIKRFIAKTRLDDDGIAKRAMCLFVATFHYSIDEEFMYCVS